MIKFFIKMYVLYLVLSSIKPEIVDSTYEMLIKTPESFVLICFFIFLVLLGVHMLYTIFK
jgi:hypothetical protein